MHVPRTRRVRGFTLVEMMVVTGIVAVLAAVAYPSYTTFVQKSRRSEGMLGLLDLATRQQRYYTMNNRYAETPDLLGYPTTQFPVDVVYHSAVYYRLNVTLEPDANGFTASAIPTGSQMADSCGEFTIDHLGRYGNTTAASPAPRCW